MFPDHCTSESLWPWARRVFWMRCVLLYCNTASCCSLSFFLSSAPLPLCMRLYLLHPLLKRKVLWEASKGHFIPSLTLLQHKCWCICLMICLPLLTDGCLVLYICCDGASATFLDISLSCFAVLFCSLFWALFAALNWSYCLFLHRCFIILLFLFTLRNFSCDWRLMVLYRLRWVRMRSLERGGGTFEAIDPIFITLPF